MIYSMTAFARAQTELNGFMVSWELRSVNHRYLEAQFRMPESLRSVEPALKDKLRKRLKRGKVDCNLRLERVARDPSMELNRPLLLQLVAVLEQVRRDAPEVSAPNAMDLLRWPGVLGDSTGTDDEHVVRAAASLFEEALEELAAHRQREGAQLGQAVSERLDAIDRLVVEVTDLAGDIATRTKQRLQQRLVELETKVDATRLEQEVALLAQRADVTEELDRLSIHVAEARNNLSGKGPHGRRLDFLTQELNREANTLGSKSTMAETSQKAVDLKVVIEQIREQVQNIE